MSELTSYKQKKDFFSRILTVYGRTAVQEALLDSNLPCYALHLAERNRETESIAKIRALAESRDIPVKTHSRAALARISRNG
ncbi:MAG: 23S rRNA (guanosine(2251)-2'-O)-methyltransferase RlmB, partial [Halieaceae bacterium]|nr:23S rRNA (guanosine(2251)-2'-O)-methyltransferase RlmB [Halieaceae bacterium]